MAKPRAYVAAAKKSNRGRTESENTEHRMNTNEIIKATKGIDGRKLAIKMEQRVRKAEQQYVMPKSALERAMSI